MCTADPRSNAFYKSDYGLDKLGWGDKLAKAGDEVDPGGKALQKSDIGVRTIKGYNHQPTRTVQGQGPSYIDQDRQAAAGAQQRSRLSIRSTAA